MRPKAGAHFFCVYNFIAFSSQRLIRSHIFLDSATISTQKPLFDIYSIYECANNINSLWHDNFHIYRLYSRKEREGTDMSEIAKLIGQRIRNYRLQRGWSQEKLAELSGCHPTYIGQLERGEKNATLEVVEKITAALNVPLSKLFEKLGDKENAGSDIPLKCYDFLLAKSKEEQEQLYRLLIAIDKYKSS